METVVCVPHDTIPDGLHLSGDMEFDFQLNRLAGARFPAVRDKTDKSPLALENDISTRQLVTYLLVQDGNSYYVYQRTSGTGETRLAGNYALPGGHMNAFTRDFLSDIGLDALRELEEELSVTALPGVDIFRGPLDGIQLPMKVIALLQSSCNEDNGVHLVHTGIVVKFDITNKFSVSTKEKGKMVNLTQITVDNYADYFKESELWLRQLLPWTNQILSL